MPKIDLGKVRGDSAYEVALKEGFQGSLEQWLNSLKGEKGDDGAGFSIVDEFETMAELLAKYPIGEIGYGYLIGTEIEGKNLVIWDIKNNNYRDCGKFTGKDGEDGLDGKNGKSAYEVALEEGFVGSEDVWLKTLKGDPGDPIPEEDQESHDLIDKINGEPIDVTNWILNKIITGRRSDDGNLY